MTTRVLRLRPLAGDGGSASLELAIIAPVLLLLLALIVMGGRFAMASAAITGVAGAAARDASLARSPTAARAAAVSGAQATLAEQSLHCQGRPIVQVDTSAFAAVPGTPASVSVDVTCVVVLNGLHVPGLPSTRTLHERAVSPLDSYRHNHAMRPPMKPPSRTRHTFAGIRVNPSSDRGSVSLWVAVMAASVLVTLVLIVDGGAKIRAGNRADIAATEAARAAVLAVGPRPAGGSGQARLAVAAATAYLVKDGVQGSALILGPGRVQVAVRATERGPISGHTFTVTRTAVAVLLVGVEKGEQP